MIFIYGYDSCISFFFGRKKKKIDDAAHFRYRNDSLRCQGQLGRIIFDWVPSRDDCTTRKQSEPTLQNCCSIKTKKKERKDIGASLSLPAAVD